MILTSGCFDGIHAGHVGFLEALTRLTHQPVVVAVASDAYVRRQKHRPPRLSEADRLAAVRGLSGVQDAFLHGEDGVWDLLREGAPWDGFAKGMDWADRAGMIRSVLSERPTALIFVNSGSHLHSSSI